jgi:glycosyltransferase involved in cell wall biosynthesis
VRGAWEIAAGQKLILTTGRLVPQKNLHLAIRALAQIPEAALVLVGEGPLEADLRREAAARAVQDRVIFAGLRPDARALMGAADVMLVPSRWEGLPLAVLEGLAAGVPIVATRVRGVRELLTHERDCLLVEPDDHRGLAAAVRRLFADPSLAARLAAAGQSVASRYTEASMVDAYLGIYRAIASRSRRHP